MEQPTLPETPQLTEASTAFLDAISNLTVVETPWTTPAKENVSPSVVAEETPQAQAHACRPVRAKRTNDALHNLKRMLDVHRQSDAFSRLKGSSPTNQRRVLECLNTPDRQIIERQLAWSNTTKNQTSSKKGKRRQGTNGCKPQKRQKLLAGQKTLDQLLCKKSKINPV